LTVISAALAAVAKHIGFAPLDYIALVLFFASWVLHFWIINHSELRHKTISFRMHQHRQRWMMNMVLRDPKMPDVLIQNTLQYGVLFFASTSILLIGGLMAALGASDQAQTILKERRTPVCDNPCHKSVGEVSQLCRAHVLRNTMKGTPLR